MLCQLERDWQAGLLTPAQALARLNAIEADVCDYVEEGHFGRVAYEILGNVEPFDPDCEPF